MTTKPTIETVLERVDSLANRMDTRFDGMDERLDRMDIRFEKLEREIHRVASLAHSTQEEMIGFRMDFKELRARIDKVLPDDQPQ
jgi:archaellum component FlaC